VVVLVVVEQVCQEREREAQKEAEVEDLVVEQVEGWMVESAELEAEGQKDKVEQKAEE
jgi:hypothetical protein